MVLQSNVNNEIMIEKMSIRNVAHLPTRNLMVLDLNIMD